MRNVELETRGDAQHDVVEVIVDLGMGSVVRVTVTSAKVEWRFMDAGTTKETCHAVGHEAARGQGFKL